MISRESLPVDNTGAPFETVLMIRSKEGFSVADLLVMSGRARSIGDAHRLIEQSAVTVDAGLTVEDHPLPRNAFLEIRVGRLDPITVYIKSDDT